MFRRRGLIDVDKSSGYKFKRKTRERGQLGNQDLTSPLPSASEGTKIAGGVGHVWKERTIHMQSRFRDSDVDLHRVNNRVRFIHCLDHRVGEHFAQLTILLRWTFLYKHTPTLLFPVLCYWDRRSEDWEWVLKSRTFDSCSSSLSGVSPNSHISCVYGWTDWADVVVLPCKAAYLMGFRYGSVLTWYLQGSSFGEDHFFPCAVNYCTAKTKVPVHSRRESNDALSSNEDWSSGWSYILQILCMYIFYWYPRKSVLL